MQACPAGRVMSAPQAQQERGGQLQQARDWRRSDLQRIGGILLLAANSPSHQLPGSPWLIG